MHSTGASTWPANLGDAVVDGGSGRRSSKRVKIRNRNAILVVTREEHKEYPRSFRCLMVMCHLGVRFGAGEDADIVRRAVERTLKDATRFHIELALTYAAAGSARAAGELMAERLQRNPDDALANVVLGLAMRAAGEADWRAPIDYVLATSADPTCRRAALNALRDR